MQVTRPDMTQLQLTAEFWYYLLALENVAQAARDYRQSQAHLSRLTPEGVTLDKALAKLPEIPPKGAAQ